MGSIRFSCAVRTPTQGERPFNIDIRHQIDPASATPNGRLRTLALDAFAADVLQVMPSVIDGKPTPAEVITGRFIFAQASSLLELYSMEERSPP
ncbi:MAG: hypothetical protein Q8K57_15635 [Thiobacillus sp.]|nr:hypothetical protein [Thiobacillus sp.]